MPEPGMPEPRDVTLDGATYKVFALDAYSAVPVWHKVARVLAPTLDALSGSAAAFAALTDGGKDISELAVLGKLVTHAAAIAVKEMDPSELRYCIDAFAAKTTVMLGAKSPQLNSVFATHFSGRLTSMAKWFAVCLEVNFGDFLEVARGIWNSAQKQKNESAAAKPAEDTSASESLAGSTG